MLTFWTFWLVAIVITFALAESYAIARGKPTLSQYVWRLSNAWKPFPWIAGFLSGFLVCHLWWGGVVCFVGCAASPVSP